jgi:hypothetical protein
VRTEQGEPVYEFMEITAYPPGLDPIKRVLYPDRRADCIGFTESFIEETVAGALKALERDFPEDIYEAVRHRPNVISLEYKGVKGPVN